MDWDRLNEYLEALEWIVPKLEEVRDISAELEVEPLLSELKRECERVREELGRLEEEEKEALRREYERGAL